MGPRSIAVSFQWMTIRPKLFHIKFTLGQNRAHTEGQAGGVCVPPIKPSCLLSLQTTEAGTTG